MEVGEVYERKGQQYKVVAKLPDENSTLEEEHIYMIAIRNFGEDEVHYFTTNMKYTKPAFRRTDHWLR